MAHAAVTNLEPGGPGRLFFDRAGQYVLIIVFFGTIVWFLRFLYGPRGMFRDPAWDRRNGDDRSWETPDAPAQNPGDGRARPVSTAVPAPAPPDRERK